MHRFSRLDVALAATPATHWVTHSSLSDPDSPVRFFSAPLLSFEFAGSETYLAAPDILATVSATVLCIRFLAWALSPLFSKKDHRK